jgi:hypothetical protein
MDISKKVPLFVIFIAIIFILIIVVILSSLGSSENPVEKTLPKLKVKKKKKISFSNINITSVPITKESDSLCFEFNDLTHDITYIFGSEFDNSSISIYKKNSFSQDSDFELVQTNVYSGNHGFVISSNPLNVNASYFQLGTRLDLENIKYNCIFLDSDLDSKNQNLNQEKSVYKVVVNNVVNSLYKVYRFTINYPIQKSVITKSKNSNSTVLGLSEYDLEYKIKHNNPLGLQVKQRMVLSKLGFKEWEFSKPGKYLLIFLKNKYNFIIQDKQSGNSWNSSMIKNELPSLEYEIIENPNLVIKNLDENIHPKSFNSDIIEFVNTPFTLYNHFLHGPKKKAVDVINRISNKILIYML